LYAAVVALVANLLVVAVLTPVFDRSGVARGTDTTAVREPGIPASRASFPSGGVA